MATVYSITGTTSHTFTLGDGTTIFYGKTDPSKEMGKIGDIYVRMTKLEKDFVIVDDMEERDNYPSEYQAETGNPLPDGSVVQIENSDYYSWNANNSSWNLITDYNINEPLGRIYYKEAFGNGSRWSFIKTYSFDDQIIHAVETSRNSNDFFISIESADNSSYVSSTRENDYDNDKNRSAYGVTRYAANSEAVASEIQNYQTYSSTNLPQNFDTSGQKFMDKYIALTPKQVADNIKVEMTRAITVEGKLNDLSTTPLDNTNIVTALKSEFDRAFLAEDKLNEKIEALIAKKDVVDIVQYYSKVEAGKTNLIDDVDKFDLSYNDIVKVLTDETRNDKTVYYKLNITPAGAQQPDYKFLTKADMDAYDKSLLHNDDIALVKTDSSQSNAETYYKYNASTTSWDYQGIVTSIWDYVGEENAYYTISEADDTFMHKIAGPYQNENIVGIKTFEDSILRVDALSSSDTIAYKLSDTNEKGSIETDAYYKDSNIYNRTRASNATSEKESFLDLKISDAGVAELKVDGTATSWANESASNSTSSRDVALVGWVNNPNGATNVVHRNGDEPIAGTKTFTGTIAATNATVNVATQTQGDNSTKAASTAYVDTGLATKQDTIEFEQTDANKCYAVNQAGTALVWREVKDFTRLDQLDDTNLPSNMSSANDGQVLIYDSSAGPNGAGAWVNGSQVTATIRYW